MSRDTIAISSNDENYSFKQKKHEKFSLKSLWCFNAKENNIEKEETKVFLIEWHVLFLYQLFYFLLHIE